jgi:hydroxymethylbilane synthase
LTLRLGTRGSALALAQARWVAERLGGEVELVEITTSGDRDSLRGVAGGDKSRFVKEIEEALLREEIDLAVHSAKDVPGELPDGLSIVGVPERADARDALCGAASLTDLPGGARVGTGALRRRAQLAALRPDLEVRDLRGNVDTRLRKLADGGYDALVLAYAGLTRLDRSGEGEPIPGAELVPAAGQGCLALEARSGDEHAAAAATAITDSGALTRLTAERAVVTTLEADCHTPVGVHAELDGELRLTAFVGTPDGSHWIKDELTAAAGDPATAGRTMADRLLAAGAAELLAAL